MSLKLDSVCNSGSVPKMQLFKARGTMYLLSLLLLALSTSGCVTSSLSESSDSLSGSFKSSSKSSTSSSGDSKESYLRDIKQYAAVYAGSNRDMKGFTRGLSSISAKHGVNDWEAYNATYIGIGEGFAKAAVSQQQADIYSSLLAQGDQLKIAAIQQGFRQGH